MDITVFYESIGRKIKAFRKEKGLDQESFADQLELSRASIVNIEKGRQRTPVHQLWAIAKVLNVSIVDLLPPMNMFDNFEVWDKQLLDEKQIEDDIQKKRVLGFISASRNSK